MVGQFVEVYRRRGLKVNAGKRKVIIMNKEEGFYGSGEGLCPLGSSMYRFGCQANEENGA